MIKRSMHTKVYKTGKPTQRRKKHTVWRKRIGVSGLFAVAIYIVVAGWLVPVRVIVGIPSAASHPQTATKVALTWPAQGQAAIGAQGYGVLASHGTSSTLPTASVIKLVTALAVLEKQPLKVGESGPTVTINQQDFESYQWYLAHHGSIVPVRVGEKLSEYQALQAMLIRSGNNLADSLAIRSYGSLAAYSEYANAMVKRLGLSDTTIGSDASGLNPSTTSTADDLVRLGEIAMKNPVLAQIVGQSTATTPEVGLIHNTNNLLGTDGIVGIKTGTDYQNKGVYLFASQYKVTPKQNVMIIGSVMGAPSISKAKQDALALLQSAKGGFTPRSLFTKDETVGTFKAPWAKAPVRAVSASDVTVLGWRGKPLHLEVTLKNVSAPANTGTQIGLISTGIDSEKKVIGTVLLDSPIQKPNLWWRLTHPSGH